MIGSSLIASGQIEFINNTAREGAALYLLSYSQVRLVNEVKIIFSGNKGR